MKANKTIFLVDDDEDDRMFMREAIESVNDGVTIIEAETGEEFLRLIGGNQDVVTLGLILMDMNMPGMGGLKAVLIIKEDPRFRHIPVIMVSTASNPELVYRAYMHGINAYMAKPLLTVGYVQIAHAINVCYLNDYTALNELAVAKNLKAKNILVIEDNMDQRRLMNLALERSMPHVNVLTLSDQTSTEEFLATGWQELPALPQLILLSLYLPNRQNGLQLLEIIRKFLTARNLISIPIIVLSQSDHPDDITDSYRRQANAYMVKSQDLAKWFSYFPHICYFWLNTINLPTFR